MNELINKTLEEIDSDVEITYKKIKGELASASMKGKVIPLMLSLSEMLAFVLKNACENENEVDAHLAAFCADVKKVIKEGA